VHEPLGYEAGENYRRVETDGQSLTRVSLYFSAIPHFKISGSWQQIAGFARWVWTASINNLLTSLNARCLCQYDGGT